jgi:hypothetical protein
MRSNLVIDGMPGDIVELSGVIRHKDCTTPIANAKVELWHCSADEIYDNDSDEFRYRGTVYTDDKGLYKFRTQMPVPYDAGGGEIRPAHFHLMVSTEQYQTLVTQIYFHGDPYLEKDHWSGAKKAQYRRLEVVDDKNGKQVTFHCNLNEELQASYQSLQQITGTYKHNSKDKTETLFAKDGVLWMKNEVFGERYVYQGNNQFHYAGMPEKMHHILEFDLKTPGKVQMISKAKWTPGSSERIEHYTKV